MKLRGKTILFLGSSVTYGHTTGGVSFADMLAQRCGCTIVKEAVSGTTLVDNGADSYVSRMKTMDGLVKADLFICQLSTNDATQGQPFGNPVGQDGVFDASTIAGAIETVIDYARRTWGCPVAFYTSPRYDSEAYERMVKLLYEIREMWGIEVLDLWNDTQFNDLTAEQYARYMADPIHPSYEGYLEWWTPAFEKKIEEII